MSDYSDDSDVSEEEYYRYEIGILVGLFLFLVPSILIYSFFSPLIRSWPSGERWRLESKPAAVYKQDGFIPATGKVV